MIKAGSILCCASFMALIACAKTPSVVLAAPVALDVATRFQATAPESECAGEPVDACLFAAIWDAAAPLPEKKRERIGPAFMSVVTLQPDQSLTAAWQRKLGAPEPQPIYPDYSLERAQSVLKESGWEGFLSRARMSQPPFNAGRPEIMAAGVTLAPSEAVADRLMDTMFELAKPKTTRGGMGDRYEMSDFGHVLAELATRQCNLERFDRAVALTNAPDSLRYALWRARITGGADTLVPRIRDEAIEDDTRHVRSSLDGVAPLIQYGYCDTD